MACSHPPTNTAADFVIHLLGENANHAHHTLVLVAFVIVLPC
jgi:hypothetical protein